MGEPVLLETESEGEFDRESVGLIELEDDWRCDNVREAELVGQSVAEVLWLPFDSIRVGEGVGGGVTVFEIETVDADESDRLPVAECDLVSVQVCLGVLEPEPEGEAETSDALRLALLVALPIGYVGDGEGVDLVLVFSTTESPLHIDVERRSNNAHKSDDSTIARL